MEVEIHLNGTPYKVGKLPHELRIKLMSQHVGGHSKSLVDMVDDQLFFENWQNFAETNTIAYDAIDRQASVYRCKTLESYQNGLKRTPLLQITDPIIQNNLPNIKGFLVNWPYNFLESEDLSPTPATRMLIPNDLWV